MASNKKSDMSPTIVVFPQTKAERTKLQNKAAFGDKIRALRTERGLSQPQLAKLVGVTKNAITNWEAGTSRPDLTYIPALCAHLGITADAFLGMPADSDRLSTAEQEHMKLYRALDRFKQRSVDTLMESMIENEMLAFREQCVAAFTRLGRHDLPASAGTGMPLADTEDSEQVLLKDVMDVAECDAEQAELLIDLSCASISLDAMEYDDDNGCVLYEARFGTRHKPITSPFSDNGLIIDAVEDRLEAELLKEIVHQALATLSERELDVIRRRCGFDGAPQTLEEIGLILGVTRERIRQIEAKVIRKLGNPRSILAKKCRPQYRKVKKATKAEKLESPDKTPSIEDERLPILSIIALQAILENHGIIYSINNRDKTYVWVSQDNINTEKLNELKRKYIFNVSNYRRGWRISPTDN